MKKYLSAFLIAGLAIGMQQAQAQSTSPASNKVVKKAPARKAEPAHKDTAIDDDEKEPDTSASSSTEFHCELGNKLTIYHNAGDDQHIALRWKQRLLQLIRVDTSTGAHRFENRKAGLVWIGIPAKGMLLDSKKGRQLANECKTVQQMTQELPKS